MGWCWICIFGAFNAFIFCSPPRAGWYEFARPKSTPIAHSNHFGIIFIILFFFSSTVCNYGYYLFVLFFRRSCICVVECGLRIAYRKIENENENENARNRSRRRRRRRCRRSTDLKRHKYVGALLHGTYVFYAAINSNLSIHTTWTHVIIEFRTAKENLLCAKEE